MHIPVAVMVTGGVLCLLTVPFLVAGWWILGPYTISVVADRLDHG